MTYEDFINNKTQFYSNDGFKPLFVPDYLFDFQKYLLEWALIKGKSAIFADTGLGKTIMQLVFADNVIRKTNKNVLIATPLAVSHQTIKEGEKFCIEVNRSRDGKPKGKITVTNYQQLEKFDPSDFEGGFIGDESSILKNFSGFTRKSVTRFIQKMPYRLLCTATPSPNDYPELGTSSETLGNLPYMEMLDIFFRDTSNDKNPQWTKPKYELLGHSEDKFWQWVSSWAKACRKPSDLGFDDTEFILPELIEREYVLECTEPLPGELFPVSAVTLSQQKDERKLTLKQRCDKVLELIDKHPISVIWAHYDYETDYLEKIIPDSVNIKGLNSPKELDKREEQLIAFSNNEIKHLIIKPKIGAFGLNWQHCNHQVWFPSHSYEQYYQGVRRCWRYGQKKKVYIDTVTTEGELRVLMNIKRKAKNASEMFDKLIMHMNNELHLKRKEHQNESINIPKWLN